VILEEVRSQNRATIEAVEAMGVALRSEIQELRAEFGARLDALEAAVRQNSADIRKNSEDIRRNSDDIRKNSEDIRQLRIEVEALKQQAARIEAELSTEHRQRLLRLETRVDALERQRLG
jgi:hypothetical protein